MATEKDFLGEAVETTQFDGTAPTAEEAAAEARDTREWFLSDGTPCSKSEFIREQFLKFNKSRKQIAEEFGINYRTVYGATVNLTNDAEPATRGRSAAHQKIRVTADGHVVTVIDGVPHVDNVAVPEEEAVALETVEVDRNEWIREQVQNGRSRSDVAAALGLSYGVVYSITKDIEGASQRHEIEYNGKVMSRSEYIRTRYAEGASKAEIAKELGVDYPVVWSALKSLKSDAEKYAEAVARLAKFADNVEDVETFNHLIEQLKGLALKTEDKDQEQEDTDVYAQ